MKQKERKILHFNRESFLEQVKNHDTPWDMIVIGGGATGLGVALDAASRGFKTLLLEQADYAKGTSSRSTKLVHGGVRYLAQGDIKLVYEALYERGLLLQNAPHLVNIQSFVIPNYSWWNELLYGVGLTVYDLMAGKYRLDKTSVLSGKKVAKLLPNIQSAGLKGGVQYFDGQFDDARLALNLAQTCAEQGGALINYMPVVDLLKDAQGKVNGVKAMDLESGKEYLLPSKTVVNATGVFVDEILQMNAPEQQPLVRPSQGVHVVLDSSFLEGNHALMIPKTPDGRVLFIVPWHQHLLVGTTDTPLDQSSLEPRPLDQEIDFILETAGKYLVRKPGKADVLSVFAGLRPLAAPKKDTNSTKEISRSHKLLVDSSGLLTITGGKWTTYRKMAQDTVDKAIEIGLLPKKNCITSNLKIHGYAAPQEYSEYLDIYGSDKASILKLATEFPELAKPLHARFPNIAAEVVWSVQNEMARTVEDVLARRMRILFLDAKAAIEMVPEVARLMAQELRHGHEWQQQQTKAFFSLASRYLLTPLSPEHSMAPSFR
ncbi:glycerol-3-phosphate dehydrogenase/oxidase [Rufibacter roseus]|uniref:FAD-dependent oxidoreductase n=1 Tax=Rufibacter roseus TaxID=1567108 RepID=A0ABW2DHG2_9BACT|nr:glycerol-3-phosphate dehydrogenase/oxidase [Rufibacter roseus]